MNESSNRLTGAQLAKAAAFMARDARFFGYWLGLYVEVEQLDLPAALRSLGCDLETWHHLSLCLRPRMEHLEQDTQELGQAYGVDPDRLADVLLQAEAFAAARAAAGPASPEPTIGWLRPAFAAASDREDECSGEEATHPSDRCEPGSDRKTGDAG